MPLINLRSVRLAYGAEPLLAGVDLSLEPGERVAIAGRNGEGKSTLLKLLAGAIEPDSGELVRREGLVCAYLDQEVPEAVTGSVFDVVAEGLGEMGRLLEQFHHLSLAAAQGDSAALVALGGVQAQLDATGAWSLQHRVETILSRLALPADHAFAALSGGLRRRVWLARAWVRDPDVLLLDEPTNHLDIAAIAWLEALLKQSQATVVFVTHDRSFMAALATRILELDRGRLFEHPPDLDLLRERQNARLEVEARQAAEFDHKLAQEEAWIRRGIKARRTRNEGRVRALEQLRRQRAERRERQGMVRMALQPEQRSGKRVIEVERASFGYPGRVVVSDLDLIIQRGDRLGLVGPNGAGKTTLLRGLLGELPPLAGTVTQGTEQVLAYFDQTRAQLDESQTVQDAVADGRDRVSVGGQSRHVLGYLEDFLFTPARSRQPVAALSGGERNRLLLARLFLRSANLLVLDEPTNDLDVETLELLETLLVDYTGTVIVVSHDRTFLDNVVTSVLVLDGQGRAEEFVGGWSDLPERVTAPLLVPHLDGAVATESNKAPRGKETRSAGTERNAKAATGAATKAPTRGHSKAPTKANPEAPTKSATQGHSKVVTKGADGSAGERGSSASALPVSTSLGAAPTSTAPARSARKLSYKETRELAALPAHIEALEFEHETLAARLGDPELFRQAGSELQAVQQRLAEVEQELALAYQRWEDLEAAR